MCCYFDDIIRFWDRDLDFNDTLLDEKLYKEKYENILIDGVSYKTSRGAKPLRIRLDKIIDRYIKTDKIKMIIVIVIKLVIRLNILSSYF